MHKNAHGIYRGTAASEDDYVVYKQGGRFHHGGGKYYVDRIGRGGTHTQIGPAKGCSMLSEARELIRKDAHTRGIKAGVVFEQRGDELVQIGHTNPRHESNASHRRNGGSGLHDDPALLQQLVEMAAESMELENYKDADVTPEVMRVAEEYDKALEWALDEVVLRYPPKNGASASDLWSAEAPYLVLMTLRGEGVGIWDGSWDEFYDKADIERVKRTLKNKLGLYADDTGGGKLEDAFRNAASETCGGDEDEEDGGNGIEIEEFDAPAHWASAFINGDTSGLEEEDLAEFEAWGAEHPELYVVDVSEGTHFGRWNGLQTELATYTAHVQESDDKSHSPNARREEPNVQAARELSLYIENEYDLVGAPNSQGKAIEKNLLRKIKNGTFNLALSEKAWMYLMETGAKKYCKEYADPKEWSKVFNKPTRELVAHEFAVTFAEENGAKTQTRNAGQPFQGRQTVVIEKRDANGKLDFSAPQPPRSSATFDEVYEWYFRAVPEGDTANWSDLKAWLDERGWVLRAKTW